MANPHVTAPVVTVLVVCTGNICRSPLAEWLGRATLSTSLGAHASAIRMHSAGTHAVVGSGMHPDSVRVLASAGVDVDEFRARQLEVAMVDEADLVLTMTGAHRQAVLEQAPRALARTFTLHEAAALARSLDADDPLGDDTLADRFRSRVRQLAGARARRRNGPEDDVRDPIGQPPHVHDEVGAAIAGSLVPLLDRLVGRAVAGGRAG